MVLAGFGGGFGFWVLGRFGWFWLVPCFSNYVFPGPSLQIWTCSNSKLTNMLTKV